jgi:hypothetical protein
VEAELEVIRRQHFKERSEAKAKLERQRQAQERRKSLEQQQGAPLADARPLLEERQRKRDMARSEMRRQMMLDKKRAAEQGTFDNADEHDAKAPRETAADAAELPAPSRQELIAGHCNRISANAASANPAESKVMCQSVCGGMQATQSEEDGQPGTTGEPKRCLKPATDNKDNMPSTNPSSGMKGGRTTKQPSTLPAVDSRSPSTCSKTSTPPALKSPTIPNRGAAAAEQIGSPSMSLGQKLKAMAEQQGWSMKKWTGDKPSDPESVTPKTTGNEQTKLDDTETQDTSLTTAAAAALQSASAVSAAAQQALADAEAVHEASEADSNTLFEIDESESVQFGTMLADIRATLAQACAAAEDSDGSDNDPQLPLSRFLHQEATLQTPTLAGAISAHQRIEALRIFLERELGVDKFKRAYSLMKQVSQYTDETAVSGQIDLVLSEADTDYFPLIVQLIVCEDGIYGSLPAEQAKAEVQRAIKILPQIQSRIVKSNA